MIRTGERRGRERPPIQPGAVWGVVDYADDLGLVELAERWGEVVPSRRDDPPLSHLRVLSPSEARMLSLSAVYGRGELPPHSDGAHHFPYPPRYSLMRAPGAQPDWRPTRLVDVRPVMEQHVDLLQFAQFTFGFGADVFLASPLGRWAGVSFIRWDEACSRATSAFFSDAVNAIREIVDAEINTNGVSHVWKPNEVLIIDNWNVLHSRPDRASRVDDQLRLLERVLIRCES